MKHTLRALLALALLVGLYSLALLLVVFLVALLLVTWSSGHPAVFTIALLMCGVVGMTVGSALLGRSSDEAAASGLDVSEETQPHLWRQVQHLAEQLGAIAPDEIRITHDARAAITEDARLLGLLPGPRRMSLGMPLLMGLTRMQLVTVIAHELSHHTHHVRFGAVAHRAQESLRRLITGLGPSTVLGRIFLAYAHVFFTLTRRVLREQEREADLAAARLVGRDVAIQALRDATALSSAWNYFCHHYADLGTAQGQRPEELFDGFWQFLEDPERQTQLEALQADPVETAPTPYDTHPSMSQRIAALAALPADGRTDDEVLALALLVDVDGTVAALEDAMYAGLDLAPTPWQRLLADAGLAEAAYGAANVLSSGRGLSPTGGTLAGLIEMLAAGRAHALVDGLVEGGSYAERTHFAAKLIGDVIAVSLVHQGKARHQVGWSGAARLVGPDDQPVDPWRLAQACAGDRVKCNELTLWLSEQGLTLTVPLALDSLDPVESIRRGRERVLAGVGPVGWGRSVFLLTSGVAVLPIQPLLFARAVAVRDFHRERPYLRPLLQDGPGALRRSAGVAFVPWNSIASVRTKHRPGGVVSYRIRLTDGSSVGFSTHPRSEFWAEIDDVFAYLLGARFTLSDGVGHSAPVATA